VAPPLPRRRPLQPARIRTSRRAWDSASATPTRPQPSRTWPTSSEAESRAEEGGRKLEAMLVQYILPTYTGDDSLSLDLLLVAACSAN
jgi:hypothetical protein